MSLAKEFISTHLKISPFSRKFPLTKGLQNVTITPYVLMKPLFSTIILSVTLLPIFSYGALSFDMHAASPSGYDTQPVTGGDWDAVGVTSANFDGGSSTLTENPGTGALTFNYTAGPNPTSQSRNYADIQITNNDSLNIAINGIRFSYSLASSGLAFVSAIWLPPGGTPGDGVSENDDVIALSSLATGTATQEFQGETVYAESGGVVIPPLVQFGDTGTLRFLFTGVGNFGNSSATLSNLSITAIVPEPSSALLLTSVLGLFGTTFRRRRKITAE